MHIDNPKGVHGRIRLDLNDTTIWNKDEFLDFLIEHQGNVIDIEVPEGVCLTSNGVYDLLKKFNLKAVNIRTHNLVESAPLPFKVEKPIYGHRYLEVPPDTDYTKYHTWNKQHKFGALYNRPTWSRIGLTGHLLANYQDQTTLNFRYNPHDESVRKFFELEQLFQVDPDSLKNFISVTDILPQQLEPEDGWTPGNTSKGHTDQLAEFYPDFLIDVVAETFNQGRSFYPTEKTTRPMLMKKPFILMGAKCFLIHLRQIGFKTFHDFWDEEYDGYGMGERYTRILKLIDTLAGKSADELEQMYADMQPILEHNYQLLIKAGFATKVTYVE